MEDHVEPECTCRAFKSRCHILLRSLLGRLSCLGLCPKCNSPHFEQPSFEELGTFSIFVIRCTECRWLRTLAVDEDAFNWKS